MKNRLCRQNPRQGCSIALKLDIDKEPIAALVKHTVTHHTLQLSNLSDVNLDSICTCPSPRNTGAPYGDACMETCRSPRNTGAPIKSQSAQHRRSQLPVYGDALILCFLACFMRAAYACVQCVRKNIVFPRKRIQGSTKLSPMDHMMHWIFVLVQKDSNAKKESY